MTNPSVILKQYWGFEEFRSPQKEIIESVISRNDTLAILPTGGGKSLCYQIPALVFEGLTLVISPLIALMVDQVKTLNEKGIVAYAITSNLTQDKISEILYECTSGKVKLLYVAPERLRSKLFLQTLANCIVDLVAIDEAHCIAQWGHDFRPSYRAISKVRNLFPKATFLALTATAPPKVQAEIIESLQLKSVQIFKKSVKRDNLVYQIVNSSSKLDDLVYCLRKLPGSSIVFVRTRKQTFEIATHLQSLGFDADFFHAKLLPEEKIQKQKAWTESSSQIMVSTNAFGMGIDKPDVRTVIHFEMPESIEAYMQEAGRAGRDGKLSIATLLYNPQSIAKQENIFKSELPNHHEFQKITRMLYNHFEIGENERFDQFYRFDLAQFIEKFDLNKRKTIRTLEFLEQKEWILFDKFKAQSSILLYVNPNQITQIKKSSAGILEFLVRTYPGIMYEEKSINEFQIARALNHSVHKVRKTLSELQQAGYLQYNDRTVKKIYFLQPRESDRIQNTLWREFEKVQVRNWKRLQDMIYFTSQNEICREKLLGRYFGENPKQNCGKCDVCQNLDAEFNPELLLEFLENSPQTLEQILTHFITSPKEIVLRKLQELLDENLVKQLDINTFQKK